MIDNNQFRLQLLEENNYNWGKLFKLKQGWTLNLQLSSKLINKKVRVFCNLPMKAETKFDRKTFYEYPWNDKTNVSPIKNDDHDKCVSIHCNRAGSFEYYFTINNVNQDDCQKKYAAGSCEFLIDPELTFSNGDSLDLNSLQMVTVLAKQLGPLDQWRARLEVAAKTNYNIIHFTPVQDLSEESNSSYCIKDHLKLLKHANSNDKFKMPHLEGIIQDIYKEWNVLSICDLVYNHMANDAPFLQDHPEATFNLQNSPHLRPAFVLDRILAHLTFDIAKGKYESRTIRAKLQHSMLPTIRYILRHEEIPKYHLEQFFSIDLPSTMEKIREIVENELALLETNQQGPNTTNQSWNDSKEKAWSELNIHQDVLYRRLKSSIDFEIVKKILEFEFLGIHNCCDREHFLNCIYKRFYDTLNQKNNEIKDIIEGYLNEAVDNVLSSVNNQFFAEDGPKWETVSKKSPIVYSYFYFPFPDDNDVLLDEAAAFDDDPTVATSKAKRIQAHNGWVMGDDPLKNFADKHSTVYIRRQLIPWGDSVKLNYGESFDNNPSLWSYMSDYTLSTAQMFHGVRLDNCHSTPLNVAQYFLDLARSVQPNLYVIAELFTNSDSIDNIFVTKLGITSLIREGIQATNPNDLGRLIHRYGGEPTGTFFQPNNRPLVETVANAIFFDITHDNESLVKRHSVYDLLPNSSLIAMCSCATGSTRGYDELVPHHINVVHETRLYSSWSSSLNSGGEINFDCGIIKAKQRINSLHYNLAIKGFSQIYVDQFDYETTVVTRYNPVTHQSVILIARTAFEQPDIQAIRNGCLKKSLTIPSPIEKILFEGNLNEKEEQNGSLAFKQNDNYINGLDSYLLYFEDFESDNLEMSIKKSRFIESIHYDDKTQTSYINFKLFPPGAISAFKVSLHKSAKNNLLNAEKSIQQLNKYKTNEESENIGKILDNLSYDELNILLFRCSSEESAEPNDLDVYNLPNYGPLVYAGLQGIMNIINKERLKNNLGHCLYENIRNGLN
jgi:glycogen debranching enzyme